MLGIEDDPSFAPAYNKTKAIELLNEAGWQQGADGKMYKNGVPFTTSVASHREPYLSMDVIFKSQLAKIGVDVRINQIDWATILSMIQAGTHEIVLTGWTIDNFGVLTDYFATSGIGKRNVCYYGTTEIDNLLREGPKTLNATQRTEIYSQILKKIIGESWWIPIVKTTNTYAIGPRIDDKLGGLMYGWELETGYSNAFWILGVTKKE